MAEVPSATLAERALQRLRKVAGGNGIEPAAIDLIEASEENFTLAGTMDVSPMCDVVSAVHPGGARGKDRKQVADAGALQAAVNRHRQDFTGSPDWIPAVTAEIKAHDGQGWGLENARVTLPKSSAIYAATQTCPSCEGRQSLTCTHCNGHGTITCTQCQGLGRENCYYCLQRGEDPQNPGHKCPTCHGTKFAPCRFCHTHRYLTCPTCQGRRGTPCQPCNATGRITSEVTVTCGAETHFRLQADSNLPSGLRRGMERIGIAQLARGHGDLEVTPAGRGDRTRPPFPILGYRLRLPYAELRIAIAGRKSVIAAVGKRCAVNGVPNFLDESLKPWRERLKQAAGGKGGLDKALEARALRECLALTVAGHGTLEAMRKTYPFGLSNDAIAGMLADMRDVLNRVTLKTRAVIAVICAALCGGLFHFLFVTGWLTAQAATLPPAVEPVADLGVLAVTLGCAWAVLNLAVRVVLQRHFPGLKISAQQKIGKTGCAMLTGIAIVWGVTIVLSPVRPLWLARLLSP